MKRKRTPPPKVQPWPDSKFALKTKWEDWITSRHFWVFLERRAPGRFGRLVAMHAIVPKGRGKDDMAAAFRSARYRRGLLDGARGLFRQAGVPDAQSADFMRTITGEFPYPTPIESFEEEMSGPLLATLLGDRQKDLSYHRTGVPDLTEEDRALIRQRLAAAVSKMRNDPEEGRRVLKLILGRDLF